jgi:soluble cytochrome b562
MKRGTNRMNRWKMTLLALPLAGVMVVGRPVLRPVAAMAAAAQEKEGGEKGEKKVKDLDTELAKQMEVIDESMKKLRRTLRKAESNKESLELIEKVEHAAAKSKDLVPALAAKKPEADRAKFVENYKKDMDTFIKSVGEMKAAVQAGQNDKAQEVYKTLKTQEDKGHDKYTE